MIGLTTTTTTTTGLSGASFATDPGIVLKNLSELKERYSSAVLFLLFYEVLNGGTGRLHGSFHYPAETMEFQLDFRAC